MANRTVFDRGTAGLLAIASLLCAAMVGFRMLYWNESAYLWLIVPNLILAWIPPLAAFLTLRSIEGSRRPGLFTWVFGFNWLIFFPNSAYITTDLKHLSWASSRETLLFDLALNMFAAMLGWFLGALSLRALHVEMNRRAGAVIGASFAAAAVLLGSLGVYLGRVLRWNSWDLAVRPWAIVMDAFRVLQDQEALLFIAAFTIFTGSMYAIVYRLSYGRN